MGSQSSAVAERYLLSRLQLAGLHWRSEADSAVPVVCLHGWLDNAASFELLGPLLSRARPVTSIDLPGHGYSDHRPPGYGYNLLDYVQDLAELVALLKQPVHIVGHSLGGIIATLYASTRPDQLRSLTLIDSLGPYVATAEDFPTRLGKGIGKALAPARKAMPVYDSREAAEAVRQSGMLALSKQAANLIVSRNLRPTDGGWTWRTDPRLRKPSLSALTEEQVLASFKAIAVPVLVVQAEGGLLGQDEHFSKRLSVIPDVVHAILPGSHHLHLDGDINRIDQIVSLFLESAGQPRDTRSTSV